MSQRTEIRKTERLSEPNRKQRTDKTTDLEEKDERPFMQSVGKGKEERGGSQVTSGELLSPLFVRQ